MTPPAAAATGDLVGAGGSAARAAAVDIAPFVVAVVPFGLAVGAAGAAAGLSLTELMFGAVTMLAGAGQLAAIQSIGRGESIAVVAAVVALVNLRFVVYGAGVAEWFRHLPRGRRLLLAFPVVDQTFLLCQQRFDGHPDLRWRQTYFLTATAILGGAFVAAQPVAYLLGAGLPAGLGLHMAAPLTFAAMLAKGLDSGGARVAAGAAALVVVAAGTLGPAALPLAIVVGAGAGAGATAGGRA